MQVSRFPRAGLQWGLDPFINAAAAAAAFSQQGKGWDSTHSPTSGSTLTVCKQRDWAKVKPRQRCQLPSWSEPTRIIPAWQPPACGYAAPASQYRHHRHAFVQLPLLTLFEALWEGLEPGLFATGILPAWRSPGKWYCNSSITTCGYHAHWTPLYCCLGLIALIQQSGSACTGIYLS